MGRQSRHPAAILHADLDAFYASVEQLLDPTLRNKPIAVGGSPSGGVVLAASYEARRCGVSGGMSGRVAKSLCPSIVFVGCHFEEYQRLGDAVIQVFHDVSPLVERISIDEAFIDVAGAVHLFGPPAQIAANIRHRVRSELGLAVSVGVASTKHLAKVASQVAKPDGLVVVEPGHEQAFLDPLPVGLLWGVGKVTEAKLHGRGIRTIGQLAASRPDSVRNLLGPTTSSTLVDRANNRDERRVQTTRRASSIGAQSACGRQSPSREFVMSTFGYLADRVTRRMRTKAVEGRTLTVRVRFPDLQSITRSHTFIHPTAELLTIRDHCVELTHQAMLDHPHQSMVSLLGLSVSQLSSAGAPHQLVLAFDNSTACGPLHRDQVPEHETNRAADSAIDTIRARFGNAAIGIWSSTLADQRIDEGFRTLVER
jgi:DNA polymerase IV